MTFRLPHSVLPFDERGRRITANPPPSSPLITLLSSLWPRERMGMVALTINQDLGYIGHRQFHNAEQAFRWLLPPVPQHSIPSQQMQDKRFRRVLTIDDLAAHARVPDAVAQAWWQRHGHMRHLGSAWPAVT